MTKSKNNGNKKKTNDLAEEIKKTTTRSKTVQKPKPKSVNADSGEVKTISEIDILSQKIKDLESKNLRLYADMQNVQNQYQIEIAQAKKIGKRIALQSILEFLNTLNISFAFVPETDDSKMLSFIETLRNSFAKLSEELKGISVEIINPKQGESFDPEIMQALSESDDDNPKVKQVVNIGLRVDSQVIQAATVML